MDVAGGVPCPSAKGHVISQHLMISEISDLGFQVLNLKPQECWAVKDSDEKKGCRGMIVWGVRWPPDGSSLRFEGEGPVNTRGFALG